MGNEEFNGTPLTWLRLRPVPLAARRPAPSLLLAASASRPRPTGGRSRSGTWRGARGGSLRPRRAAARSHWRQGRRAGLVHWLAGRPARPRLAGGRGRGAPRREPGGVFGLELRRSGIGSGAVRPPLGSAFRARRSTPSPSRGQRTRDGRLGRAAARRAGLSGASRGRPPVRTMPSGREPGARRLRDPSGAAAPAAAGSA